MSKHLYLVFAVFWAAAIFIASSQPGSRIGLPNPWDKLAHGLSYALLAWLLRKSGLSPFWAATLAAIYGLGDEWHQRFVPGRYCDVTDLLADSGGALIGSLLGRSR